VPAAPQRPPCLNLGSQGLFCESPLQNPRYEMLIGEFYAIARGRL